MKEGKEVSEPAKEDNEANELRSAQKREKWRSIEDGEGLRGRANSRKV